MVVLGEQVVQQSVTLVAEVNIVLLIFVSRKQAARRSFKDPRAIVSTPLSKRSSERTSTRRGETSRGLPLVENAYHA